jgi:hypothetical protein
MDVTDDMNRKDDRRKTTALSAARQSSVPARQGKRIINHCHSREGGNPEIRAERGFPLSRE